MDRVPFLVETRMRLTASLALLTDLLPKHVVEQMLDDPMAEDSIGKEAWIVEGEGVCAEVEADADADVEEVGHIFCLIV